MLALLARSEKEFSGRRIHRLLGHSSEPGVRKAAERLVDQGIVLRRQAGRANLYRLNRSHLAASQIEGLATLRTRLISRLQEAIVDWKLPPHSILLFGSVARGEGGAGSDLDILVIRGSEVDEESAEWREQLASLESDAYGWTGNDTRIVEFDEEEVAGGNRLVEEVLADGVELYGSRRRLRELIEARA